VVSCPALQRRVIRGGSPRRLRRLQFQPTQRRDRTYYHKFNDQWHITFESYTLSQRNVLNAGGQNPNPTALLIAANGGFPFNVANGFNFNSPNFAICGSISQITCTARDFTALSYLNYKFSPLDNLSFRLEYFNDMQGQRTTVKTRYVNPGDRLAALVLAAGRDSSGSRVLPLARRACLQRQFQQRAGCHGRQCDLSHQELCLDRLDGPDLALLIGQTRPASSAV
jgi:hypothetical protein